MFYYSVLFVSDQHNNTTYRITSKADNINRSYLIIHLQNPLMTTKSRTLPLIPIKMETFGSQSTSNEENGSPKNFSFENIESYRSDASKYEATSPMHHRSPVNDFKKSLEKEKNLMNLMNKFQSLAEIPDSVLPKGTEKVISVIEKNYSLQIQTLLEQVNKLKLEKKIMEKKLSSSPCIANSRNDLRDSSTFDSYKMTLGAKNSTINELEFQLQQLRNENSNLKMAMDVQRAEMEKITDGLREYSTIKCQLEDNNDEIELLRQKLELKDTVQAKLQQELQQLRSENVHLKFKSQNNSFIGYSESKTRPHSRDTSFISTTPDIGRHHGHNRTHSDYHSGWAPTRSCDLTSSNHHLTGSYGKKRGMSPIDNHLNDTSFTRIKSRLSSLGPNPCLKMLNEYEKTLMKERQANPDMQRKITSRLIELKKLKSHCIEQENLRLMSILKERPRPNKREGQAHRLEDSLIVGKSSELDLSYATNENF